MGGPGYQDKISKMNRKQGSMKPAVRYLKSATVKEKKFDLPLPSCAFSDLIKVMTAQGLHLFPFRTEKLNLATPMVLRKRESR